MPEPSFVALTDTLLGLPQPRQRSLAVALAGLALPFAELSNGDHGKALGTLITVLRRGGVLIEVEQARHQLFEAEQLREAEEPVGLAWYSHRARVAWIYAADAATTAPRDGVLNTFLVLDDMLDQADADLGRVALGLLLREELADGDPQLDALQAAIPTVVERLKVKLAST